MKMQKKAGLFGLILCLLTAMLPVNIFAEEETTATMTLTSKPATLLFVSRNTAYSAADTTGGTVSITAKGVTKNYSMQNDEKVTVEGPTAAQMQTAGTYTVRVISKEYETASAAYEITVFRALERIEVATPPLTTQYYIGDTFDPTGMTLHVYYTGSTTPEIVQVTSTMCKSDLTLAGSEKNDYKKSVTISYTGVDKNRNTVELKTSTEIQVYPEPSATISYRTHVQNVGWTSYAHNDELSGTTGRSLRMEAIQIGVSGLSDPLTGTTYGTKNYGVHYRVHLQGIGWQNDNAWIAGDAVAGTLGQSRRMEALQIELTGAIADYYDVYYRTHVQNVGWQGWMKNGETSGTTGRSLRLEAIQIRLVLKGTAK